jgi:hypothetical protein
LARRPPESGRSTRCCRRQHESCRRCTLAAPRGSLNDNWMQECCSLKHARLRRLRSLSGSRCLGRDPGALDPPSIAPGSPDGHRVYHMTSLGLLFVMAWLAGIVITTAGLRSSRTGLTVIGALLFYVDGHRLARVREQAGLRLIAGPGAHNCTVKPRIKSRRRQHRWRAYAPSVC